MQVWGVAATCENASKFSNQPAAEVPVEAPEKFQLKALEKFQLKAPTRFQISYKKSEPRNPCSEQTV